MTRGAWDGHGAAVTEEDAAGGPWADLYEREAELAALSEALAEARAGTGGLVVVEGPAGIGKSRLLAEARAAAAARGMTVLTARGTDLEREAPFGVVAELFAAVRTATPGTAVQGTPGAAGSGGLLSGQAWLATPLFDPAVPAGEDPSALVRGLYWLTVDAAGPGRGRAGRPGFAAPGPAAGRPRRGAGRAGGRRASRRAHPGAGRAAELYPSADRHQRPG